MSQLLAPDSLELVYSCSVHKINKEYEIGIRDCNEGLSSNGHDIWRDWACPSYADIAGSGKQLSALVKIKVLLPWEHSCMHSPAKFVLFSSLK